MAASRQVRLPLFALFLAGCPAPTPAELDIFPCTAEHHCRRTAGQVACESGYVFAAPDDGADFRCVPAEGGDEGCEPLRLQSDGVLDLSAGAVTVTGTVTLDGAPLPNGNASRGTLRFVGLGHGAGLDVALGSSGGFSYEVLLPPGAYRLAYVPNAAACADAPDGALPCAEAPLGDPVTLSASGVLDVDIPTVRVNGGVTVNGGAAPSEPRGRGALTFARAGGVPATVQLQNVGNMSYRVTLVPGRYSIAYQSVFACSGAEQPGVPCNSGVVEHEAPLVQAGTFDVDIPLVRLAGTVDLAGALFPTNQRGALTFSQAGGGELAVALPPSGPAAYEVSLLEGDYAVGHLAEAPPGCASGEHTLSPCASQRLIGCAIAGGAQ